MNFTLRKVLLLGPSGVGKSTLCNVIHHQNVELGSLDKPAGVSYSAQGVTSEVSNYWCDNTLIVTDTIGFDDARYDPVKIAQELRRMLNVSNIKYNKVILCLRLGRLSEPARIYLRLLKGIFQNPWSNMVLYISGNEVGINEDQFIQENILSEDEDLKDLITNLVKQKIENTENGIEMENIILGSLVSHTNPETDRRKFLDDRKDTLRRIMKVIDTDTGVAKVNSASQLIPFITEFIEWLFITVRRTTYPARAAVKMITSSFKVSYKYGECPICLNDEIGGRWIMTECGHRFHVDCINGITNNQCPMCREAINSKKFFKLPQ